MTQELQPGLSTNRKVTVDRDRTIGFMGDACRVYATPAMIWDIENACRDLIFEATPAGQDSVGTRVDIAHLAATPLGMEVEITVRVAETDGRRVRLEVSARDPLDEICKGTHERFVVDIDKTRERLEAKAARVGQS